MLTVSVVITTSLSSRSAPFGAPGVCCNLRFIIDVDTEPERSEEPTGPMKTDFDAAGIARKRGERTLRCQSSWHLKVTARGAWASHTRARQDHTHPRGRKKTNFIQLKSQRMFHSESQVCPPHLAAASWKRIEVSAGCNEDYVKILGFWHFFV